jgi:hypothetical protein
MAIEGISLTLQWITTGLPLYWVVVVLSFSSPLGLVYSFQVALRVYNVRGMHTQRSGIQVEKEGQSYPRPGSTTLVGDTPAYEREIFNLLTSMI